MFIDVHSRFQIGRAELGRNKNLNPSGVEMILKLEIALNFAEKCMFCSGYLARARARPALVSVGPPALTHKAKSHSPTSARASMTAAVFVEYARLRYDFHRFSLILKF